MSELSDLFKQIETSPSKSIDQFDNIFDEAAKTHGVSKSLLKSIARQESNFNPSAVSPAGATGIMQIMPQNWERLGISDPYNPRENIMGGAKLFRELMDEFNDERLALAGYKAGAGAVRRAGGIPKPGGVGGIDPGAGNEATQDYVNKVLGHRSQFQEPITADFFKQFLDEKPFTPPEEPLVLAPEPETSAEQNPSEVVPTTPDINRLIPMPEAAAAETTRVDIGEPKGPQLEPVPTIGAYDQRDQEIPEKLPIPEEKTETQRVQELIKEHPDSENAYGALAKGILYSVPGMKSATRAKPEDIQALRQAFPAATTVGGIAGNIAQAFAGGAVVKGGVGLLKLAPLAKNLVTRAVVSGGLTALKGAENVARGEQEFKEAFWDTVQSLGASQVGGAVELVPGLGKVSWKVIQAIGQPAADLAYDASVDALRGKDVGSKEWWAQELVQLGLSEGFALRDIASGKTFELDQKLMRKNAKQAITKLFGQTKKAGKDGFEIVASGVPVGRTLPQTIAEGDVTQRFTEDITQRQEQDIETLKRPEQREPTPTGGGEFFDELSRRVKTVFPNKVPTKNEVVNAFGVTREEASLAIKNAYPEQQIALGRKPQPKKERRTGDRRKKSVPVKKEKRVAPRRKTINELSQTEAQKELATDELTGLMSKRAWKEARDPENQAIPTKKYVASMDVDALKWVNDNMGHQSGDILLKSMGDALKKSEVEDAAHPTGDEFLAQSDDPKKLMLSIQRAQNILKDKTITAKLPDGSTVTYKGAGFSYGISKSEADADAKLRANKASREAAGLRPARGTEPSGVVKVTPKRQQDRLSKVEVQADPADGENPSTKPPVPAETNTTGAKPLRPSSDHAESFEVPHRKSVLDSESGFVDVSAPVTASSKIRAMAKEWFSTKGNLPDPVFEAKLKRDHWLNAEMKEIERNASELQKESKKSFGKVTDEQSFLIDQVFKGERDITDLPENLRPVINRMRSATDALSQKMIDEGVVEGPLAGIISDNLGYYAHRSYRAYDDPKWAQKVPEDVRNNAKAFLRQENPDLSEDEIKGLIGELLYKENAPVGILSQGSKLGAKNLTMLKNRKVIPEQIRALWGEYKNADVNYAKSVSKMANAIANHNFLKESLAEGQNKFFFDTPTGDNFAKIAADGSSVLAPLNGKYTTPEIKKAFEDAVTPEAIGDFMKLYLKANSAVKYAKTIGSWMTHVRNVTGNVGFAIANGHVRAQAIPQAFKATVGDLAHTKNKDMQAYIRRLTELGVVGDGARSGEIKAIIKDASEGDIDALIGVGPKKGVRKLLRGTEKLYGAEDDVWKIYAFENERARYKKAMPELSDEELDQQVAKIVRDTYPTYSMIPKAVKKVRRFPLVGTFVSFPAEVMRTAKNTIGLASKELQNPATRSIGAQRLAGIVAAATLTGAVGMGSRLLTGTTKDKDNAQRKFLPPWAENQQIIHTGVGDDKNPTYINLGYTDPHSYLKAPVMAFLRGEDIDKATAKAITELFSPFLSEDILTQKLLDVSRNQKKGGGRVWNPSDTDQQKAIDIIGHVIDAVTPGTISGLNRMWKSGQEGKGGTVYDFSTEAIAQATGVRVSKMDIPRSLRFKAFELRRNLINASQLKKSRGEEFGEQQEERIIKEFYPFVEAASKSGMTEDEIIKAIRDGGISKKVVFRLISGDFE